MNGRCKLSVWAVMAGVVLLTAGAGCVRRDAFDAKVAELQSCQGQHAACQQKLRETQAQAEALSKQAADLQATLEATRQSANRDLGELKQQFDEATALNASLRQELERKGADVDKLLREKGAMAQSMDQMKSRLEELRRAQAAAERRAEMLRSLIDRFRKMADAGQLEVTVRRGRMVLQLPNDVLFDSGRADLKPQGRDTLVEVASILREIRDRQFQIAGHTDDQPIRSSRFPSNWYLSSARAIRVVELLVENGVAPERVSACGYGEFDPIGPNDSDEARAKNRRIEIVVQPNVDELMAIGTTPAARPAVPLRAPGQ